jgi:hypothetical protein
MLVESWLNAAEKISSETYHAATITTVPFVHFKEIFGLTTRSRMQRPIPSGFFYGLRRY